ncbi:chorismate synthase [bacterium (Candidatus Blackallbacteria) CG17_big_fil_post_rev_8_21_14_2_50_48_46]|uniref:Chorismate synthase n=1 Tax=bacterium (Candidatus Blackallbacteria) CG17_big_fil_post_rev_8_21_14_2_50_48_46 TaxID=2014261 RepID=A0A2M7FZ95_9BACT|nr:MAG: chorismate synthase [bacterium (Candidatus Blackallbacteria) CG18_big_fil_WC_8_21_14_2_50_49_26]PIW14723.1 MAG: chorismate synthase [bacterium (Candidatus Blackallbacteria) CG17_big_fil_post_rev_8_21_14_2_50_48_46]PIW50825.1 MAG: chorismate synthase [bacterium (Candidatus Blackallbacteria) CG13_big_fil_rev_8_21_14_2_50_49_14]
MRFLTAGESHGPALMGILEGLPAGLEISPDYLQAHMKRRQQGYGRGRRQQIETDHVQIQSGVRHGKTLGSPIGLYLPNQDWRNWEDTMSVTPIEGPIKREVFVPRPGHADLVGGIKYDHPDLRNVLERASARETAMRVALGTLARRFLEALNIQIASRVVSIGSVQDSHPLDLAVSELNARVDASPVRCLGAEAEQAMIAEIDAAKAAGDTLGGVVEIYAEGLPIGLGSYSQWDRKLEAAIGAAFLSMNAFKGVELGLGFESARVPGSQAHDEILPGAQPRQVHYASNRGGGIVAGMSTGQPVIIRAAMKPIATLMQPLRSVHSETGEAMAAHIERSDTCAVPAAAVIGEALLALVLAEFVLEKFGGDSMAEIYPRIAFWREQHP